MQKFALELQGHFEKEETDSDGSLRLPEIHKKVNNLQTMTTLYTERQKIYFGGLTILPCNIKLSVAPARALTPAQAVLEGSEAAAIHQAVRKGDVLLDQKRVGILGVKVGSRNKTLLAVLRGLLKSFVVDGLMRLDGASLNFSGVSLRNYTSTGSQLTTALGAHYLASLRQNLPAVLGSLAALGNPLGLVRGTFFKFLYSAMCNREPHGCHLHCRSRRRSRVRSVAHNESTLFSLCTYHFIFVCAATLFLNQFEAFSEACKKWMRHILWMALRKEPCHWRVIQWVGLRILRPCWLRRFQKTWPC